MDLDYHHENLRNKLDTLGFTQHLPIGAMSLVSAILDDLLKTTNSLKKCKETVKNLLEEKAAWDLNVEPYKCDNAKLLAECNQLHLEINKQRDKNLNKISELKKTIYNLESDKQYLEEHCTEIDNKLRHIELKIDPSGVKNRRDVDMNKKPFISTVRSGYIVPSPLMALQNPEKCTKCLKCTCNALRKNYQNTIQNSQTAEKIHADKIDIMLKQIEERDREIQRLSLLLVGGRPTTALAKDCCFKGVGNLTEDVKNLQKDKIMLQNQLRESNQGKHEAMERAMQLGERIEQLERNLKDIDVTALAMESEANIKVQDKEKYCNELKMKLNKAKNKINDLQNEIINLKDALIVEQKQYKTLLSNQSIDNKKNIYNQLNTCNSQVEELQKRNEKLIRKNSKLINAQSDIELKLLEISKKANIENADLVISDNRLENKDFNKIKLERDNIQKEYLKLLSMQSNKDTEIDILKTKLNEKQLEIDTVTFQLTTKSLDDGTISSRSVQSTINRIERERDLLKCDVERLITERNDYRKKMQLLTDSHSDEKNRLENRIQEYMLKITQLESENHQFSIAQIPVEAKINVLKKEVDDLIQSQKTMETENRNLKTSYNQLKLLQDQSEKSLANHQNQLMHTENQLGQAESRLSVIDSSREQNYIEIAALKGDIVLLKAANTSLEKEKDNLLIQLDTKTEKLFNLESDFDKMKSKNLELNMQITELRKTVEDFLNKNKQKEESLFHKLHETETLQKQIAQLKRVNDNALSENSRLINEISDLKSDELTLRRQFNETEKEVDRLKYQLQQYVQEVHRVEDLLLKKQEERDEMLERFLSLSQDAMTLEGNNRSLELAAAESKQHLLEAENKIVEFQNKIDARDNQIDCFDNQIKELSKHVKSLQMELDSVKSEKNTIINDLNNIKNLCNKLDLEKAKLNAELNECNDIRRKLERENDKLRCEINLIKSGNTGSKVAIDSLQELLTTSRQEFDQQKICTNKLNQEIKHLKSEIVKLEIKLSEEHANTMRNEALAKEYNIQIHELQHKLTDERFTHRHSKESDSTILSTKKKSSMVKNASSNSASLSESILKVRNSIVEESNQHFIEKDNIEITEYMKNKQYIEMPSEMNVYFNKSLEKRTNLPNINFSEIDNGINSMPENSNNHYDNNNNEAALSSNDNKFILNDVHASVNINNNQQNDVNKIIPINEYNCKITSNNTSIKKNYKYDTSHLPSPPLFIDHPLNCLTFNIKSHKGTIRNCTAKYALTIQN